MMARFTFRLYFSFLCLIFTPMLMAQNLLGDIESGGFFADTPENELFGSYDLNVQAESIGRLLFSDPNSNFFDSFTIDNVDQGLYLSDEFSGDVYFFSIDDYQTGSPPALQNIGIDDIPSNAFNLPIFICYCYFYNNLPDIQLFIPENKDQEATIVVSALRKRISSQTELNRVVSELKQSPISLDPFVQLGLRDTADIVLISNSRKDGNRQASPSQYSDVDNIIYINQNDLDEYGYVVIVHELLQAGLQAARVGEYISKKDFNSIVNLNKNYFDHLNGYVGVTGEFIGDKPIRNLDNLNLIKAFAVGYTYDLFKRNYSHLPGAEKNHARSFFIDVESNKKISRITLGTSETSANYYLLGNPEVISQRDIDDFIEQFTNSNRAVHKKIKLIAQEIESKLKRDTYILVMPAIMLAN